MRWEQVYLSEPRISLKGSPCLVAGLLRIVAKIPLPLVWSKSWKPFKSLCFCFCPYHELPPSCSWWHPKFSSCNFWPGYQFWHGFVRLYLTLFRSLSTVSDWPLGSSCLWQAMFFVVMFFNAFRKNAICCSPASPSSPSSQRFTGGDC